MVAVVADRPEARAESISRAGDVDPAAKLARGDEVCDELAVLAGQANRVDGRIVELVAEAHRDGLCVGPDLSLRRWVGWRLGCEPARAAKIAAIAERADELPTVLAELGAGSISLDQAAVLARRAPASHEAEAADRARRFSPSQLRRWCATLPPLHDEDLDLAEDEEAEHAPAPGADEPDGTEDSNDTGDEDGFRLPPPVPPRRERRRRRAHRLSLRYDDDGTGLLSGVLPPEVAAALDAALRAQLDALWVEHRQQRDSEPGDELTGEPTIVDALARLVGAAQSAEAEARPHSLRTRTIIHVDLDTEVGRFHLGPAIPASLLRYLTCDSTFRVLYEAHGVPLGIGRASQQIPDRTRITVEDRDRGCRVPGCERRFVQIHHLRHWTRGGKTETPNLIALCPHHHRSHHNGRLAITGTDADDPDAITFRDPNGRLIRGRPPPATPDRLPEPPAGRPYQRPEIGTIPNWFFQPPPGMVEPVDHDPTDTPVTDPPRYDRDGQPIDYPHTIILDDNETW